MVLEVYPLNGVSIAEGYNHEMDQALFFGFVFQTPQPGTEAITTQAAFLIMGGCGLLLSLGFVAFFAVRGYRNANKIERQADQNQKDQPG